MPSLKSLRLRIRSVRATQKITRAMKMVAASKLRRAQGIAESARPYAERMERMLGSLAASLAGQENAPPLLVGRGRDEKHLLIVATADRGLCGAFNTSIVRAARARVSKLQRDGKTVSILCLGRKGRDQLRRDLASLIVETIENVGDRHLNFALGSRVAARVTEMFEAGAFDRATVVYNRFKSILRQDVTFQQLIPFEAGPAAQAAGGAIYEYEPEEEEILADLLPRNLAVQFYRALLENAASEQASRMTAMDNATRNAGDMINRLSLQYNRTRQAAITKEIIEIVSGAEAV